MTLLGRSWLVNGTLMLLAIILTAVVVFGSDRVTTDEAEARRSSLLGAFRREDVTRIIIERRRPDPSRVMLERVRGDAGPDSWALREPFLEVADTQRVEELLDVLDAATVIRRLEIKDTEREAYGFAAPRAVLRLDMGHIGYRVLLGKPTAAPHDAVFLEVTGEDAPRTGAVAVRRQLVDELFVSPDQLRSRRLMPYTPSDLKQLALLGAGGSRVLVRGEWGGWRFASDYGGARLKRTAVEQVVAQLPRLEALQLLDPNTAEQALANQDQVRVEAVPADARLSAVIVRVGGRCPGINGAVALRERPDRRAGCVPTNVFRALATSAESLFDESLFSLLPQEVERVKMTLGRQDRVRLELARKGVGFEMVSPSQPNVPTEAAEQLLLRLTRARGKLVDRTRAGGRFADPRGRVTLKPTGGPERKDQVVVVGRAGPDGRIFVMRGQDRAVLEIDRETADLLEPDLELLRPHELFTWQPDAIREVEIGLPGTRQRVRATGSGTWELTRPPGFRSDATAITELLRALSSLRVSRWVSAQDEEALGLAVPIGSIRILVARTAEKSESDPRGTAGKEGQDALILSIGGRAPGGRYAKLTGRSGAFVLPRSSLADLERLAIDRSPFIVPVADVLRITLEREGRTVSLVSQGATMVESSSHALLGEEELRELTETLSTLRAEAAIRVGPPLAHEGFRDPRLVVRVVWRDQGAPQRPERWMIGAADAWRGTAIYYARADGVDATFAIARSRLERLLDIL